MLLLDLESELIIALNGDRALGMDHFHPNDRKGSGVVNQLENGLMKLGRKRREKHLGGCGVVSSIVAVIQLQLWSDFCLHRLEGEVSVLLDDVRHVSSVHWIGDISDCVQTTILELPPDCVLEGYQVIGPIKLRFETGLAKVVTRLGAELVATLIRHHWRCHFAFTFKVSPTAIRFPASWDSSARDSRVLTNAACSEKFSWAERVEFSYLVRAVAKCLLEGPFFLGGSIRISVVALNARLERRGAKPGLQSQGLSCTGGAYAGASIKRCRLNLGS